MKENGFLAAEHRVAGALAFALFLGTCTCAFGAGMSRTTLPAQVPSVVARLTPEGVLPATNNLSLAISLPLHHEAQLDELLRQLQDPHSTNYHRFLSPSQFTTRFGPTKQEYQTTIHFAHANGLSVAGEYSNRLVLDVEGSVSNIQRAFQVTLRVYQRPTGQGNFYAPDTAPSVPTNVPVNDVWGLSDYHRPRPLSAPVPASRINPLNYNGSGPSGAYEGHDFRNAYVPGTTLNGAGQSVAVAEFDGYYSNDIATYEADCGYAAVPLTNILINVTGTPSSNSNHVAEVSLDIEMAIAMAPGLSQVMVYEGSNPYDVFNKIASDDVAKQISCSWTWGTGPATDWTGGKPGTTTLDALLKQMAAQGQSFFQASGDSDAYTSNNAITASSGPIPVDSIYVTSVGGTSLTMSGGAWSSETVWNWNKSGRPNMGSGGGISPNYPIPYWQTNVDMTAVGGSSTDRNIPDVALTADAVYVVYNNGSTGIFGGTSCAAPLWAAFTALVNQQSYADGGASVGFLDPAFYAIANSPDYTACFHDITSGNNIGTNTPGLFYAASGYDLCTGLGTPNGANLINALVPAPSILTPPASQTLTNGNSATFGVVAGGQTPLSYQWFYNGTALTNDSNVSGATGSVLNLASVTAANAGNYNVIVTNSYGSVTSSVATLTVVFPPSFTAEPTDEAVMNGGTAIFSAGVAGAPPMAYQWQYNGTNLTDSGHVSGATSNVLTLTSVILADSGNYTLLASNLYGTATSSAATLTVMEPPVITVPPASQTIQCGSNAAFSVTATGTEPLNYQWSLDGTPITGATGTNLLLNDVHLPDHTVAVVVTNLYGSVTNSVILAVQDTLPPVITLNGSNPMYVELGSAYVEPGATAYDLCMGAVPVTITGTVNTNAVGTNTIFYTASDSSGNTDTVTRTVIVQDTIAPTIEWSFTNLVLAANTNCGALMPNVTGTNYILATDESELLTITQSPTNGTMLAEGTNVVILTVLDPYGNAAYSTNTVTVKDETPPVIWSEPLSQSNEAGANVTFSIAATACTPLSFQWYFNNAPLTGQTDNTLTVSNLNSTLAGDYFAVATASSGSTTSAVAVLTVTRLVPALALASSENPSGFKDNLNFSATVTPTNATGSVQFLTNAAVFDREPLLAGIAASSTNDALPRGTNLIMAIYSGDPTYLPVTNTLAQIVTNHPPIVLPFATNRYAGYPLYIPVADLSSNWSDPDGDTLSLAGIGVSTNGVTVTNDAGTLVYVNTNNVNDLFVCTVSDGWGGTSYQTVSVSVTQLPSDATPSITSASGGTNNTLLLDLVGGSGFTYVLETTTNLAGPVWLPVATNTLGTNGIWQFSAPIVNSQGFYRLQLQQ